MWDSWILVPVGSCFIHISNILTVALYTQSIISICFIVSSIFISVYSEHSLSFDAFVTKVYDNNRTCRNTFAHFSIYSVSHFIWYTFLFIFEAQFMPKEENIKTFASLDNTEECICMSIEQALSLTNYLIILVAHLVYRLRSISNTS